MGVEESKVWEVVGRGFWGGVSGGRNEGIEISKNFLFPYITN